MVYFFLCCLSKPSAIQFTLPIVIYVQLYAACSLSSLFCYCSRRGSVIIASLISHVCLPKSSIYATPTVTIFSWYQKGLQLAMPFHLIVPFDLWWANTNTLMFLASLAVIVSRPSHKSFTSDCISFCSISQPYFTGYLLLNA